jgi:hypothetical protein
MFHRHHAPGIESRPVQHTKGLEQVKPEWVGVLRWLHANRVEHVLVGAAAHAVRGDKEAHGPVAIVPAPYGRNLERLARALTSAHARLRAAEQSDTAAVKITAEKLASGERWTLRCGEHDLDIEARPAGVPRYQELLYEAGRFELEPGLSVEVASLEDLEHFEHVWRTGSPPEIKIARIPEPASKE